jgi:hypothetical protein
VETGNFWFGNLFFLALESEMSPTPDRHFSSRNIINLLAEDGIQATHASGDEFHSPCPRCGGRDRLSSFPNKPNQDGRYMGGRFVCRQCHWHGDAATYLMEQRGLSFPEACSELGVDPQTIRPLSAVSHKWTPAATQGAPGDAWRGQASEFLKSCQSALQARPEALAWLESKRGLTAETVSAAGLGLNTKDLYFDRAAWGLPEETNERTGKAKRVWLPAGLVIPWLDAEGKVIRLRVRRNDPGDGARYIVASGSCMAPMMLWRDQATVAIVESELDAMLIHQDAGDLVGAVAMGSAQAKPDESLHKRLMAAECILVSLDTDEAGGKAAWTFWKQYPGFKRWPTIKGKDPNEQRLNGLPVRLWVEAALVPDEPQGDPHQAEVEIKTPTGPRILRIADLNKPTEAEIDLADEMLTRLAEQPGPVSEGDIIGAVDADPTLARNILYRLSVDGIVEPLPGGLYQIPDYPPPAANLPEGCPLLGGPFPETGCRFHPRLFKTLYEQGVIPLPDGRCPLRNVCKI